MGDRPGAALDVALTAAPERTVAEWHRQVRRLLDAVGWSGEEAAARIVNGGASLVISAPVDGLYVATSINEAAWAAADAAVNGAAAPDADATAARLREEIVGEHDTRLRALRETARLRGLTFLADDDLVSIGSGRGVAVWPRQELPEVPAVDWHELSDVPIVLVTGSNGKTTSVRMLAAIARAAGLTPGHTTTDGAHAGPDVLAGGDYAGPMGARLVLRDPRIEIAILETARGGILRRGLAVEHADATLITNVAADHLDDFGLGDLATLASVKLVAARVVRPGGRVMLNADDPGLVQFALGVLSASWFAIDRAAPLVSASIAAGGDAAFVEDGRFMLAQGGRAVPVAPVDAVPATLGGAAGYNVSNVLGVIATAAALARGPVRDFTVEMIGEALGRFGSPDDNPGRGNLFDLGGVRVLVDYGHNPHGLRALRPAVESLSLGRRAVTVGQAGDRGDEAIRELARAAWQLDPQLVILKELPSLYRGRAPGSVCGLLAAEFGELGLAEDAVLRAATEVEALGAALTWARAGDLVIMLTHEDRPGVMAQVERLRNQGWWPGQPVPVATT